MRDAEGREAQERLLVLDALGHGPQAEAAAEVDDGLHDRRVGIVAHEVADERAVDLQLVDRQVLEDAERRVAGAEVVDRDADAGRDEPLDDAQRALGVGHQRVLRDLDPQPRGGHAAGDERWRRGRCPSPRREASRPTR